MKLFKSNEHKYVIELWGSSTKHPDSVFFYDDERFKKSECVEDTYQIYQWILWCASNMDYPFHAYKMAEDAKSWYFKAEGFDERIESLPEWYR